MSRHFTVIIPTRERADTLEHALRTCTAQNYDNLQIIVCDNASKDHTRDVVIAANDPRIRYINPGRRLSMMENFEFAFSHASHGYVFSMGDDDGLARGAIIKADRIIEETSCQALISDFAHYMWPNMEGSAAGQLVFSRKSGHEIRLCQRDLNQVLYSRRAFNHLPCIYYGFIQADVLNQLRQMHGKLFMSNIVDLFSSIAISLQIKQYAFSFEPLAINGTSSRSNGAAFMQISGNQVEKEFWDRENVRTSLPPFQTTASIKMMLAEACYALKSIQSPLYERLNLDLLTILKHAHLDVSLYRRSGIDASIIEQICSDLGHPGLKPNALQKLFATVQLYRHRIPKFVISDVVDSLSLNVTNVDGAAQLLQQLLAHPGTSLFDKFKLLARRYQAVR